MADTTAYCIEVSAEVRYWEDADVNGVEDADGTLIPFRAGNLWKPLIRLADGYVIGWTEGMTASIHYKVADQGEYWLTDESQERIAKWKGSYVPDDFLCHGDQGYGDYIIFNVGADGKIACWESPDIADKEWVAIARKSPATPPEDAAHSDDAAVDHFAVAMKTKMAASRVKGRGGWDDPQQCTAQSLQKMLVEHIEKGDPVDVGNFAMMLFNRGERTTVKQTADAALADAVALLHKVAKSDVMSDRSGVMFVHLAIDRDVIDDINALLASSQSATGGA